VLVGGGESFSVAVTWVSTDVPWFEVTVFWLPPVWVATDVDLSLSFGTIEVPCTLEVGGVATCPVLVPPFPPPNNVVVGCLDWTIEVPCTLEVGGVATCPVLVPPFPPPSNVVVGCLD
jgi:hypothetical protein